MSKSSLSPRALTALYAPGSSPVRPMASGCPASALSPTRAAACRPACFRSAPASPASVARGSALSGHRPAPPLPWTSPARSSLAGWRSVCWRPPHPPLRRLGPRRPPRGLRPRPQRPLSTPWTPSPRAGTRWPGRRRRRAGSAPSAAAGRATRQTWRRRMAAGARLAPTRTRPRPALSWPLCAATLARPRRQALPLVPRRRLLARLWRRCR